MAIIPGLVSITFRQLSVDQITNLVSNSNLKCIEWGGDVHVPHGDITIAEDVKKLTADKGLEVAAYGSYYRVAVSEDDGLSFDAVLNSAVALGAPKIRVWAGGKDSQGATEADWKKVVSESRRIADLAAAKGIKIVYEFHDGTLTNTYNSCIELLKQVNHKNVYTYWQPIHGAGAEVNSNGLKRLLPWLDGAHVFHWWPTHMERHPLCIGVEDWAKYLEILNSCGKDLFALMEFVKDDEPDNLLKDATFLNGLLDRIN